ncbi:M23 family metallopeptidase [Marinobacter caseinilyticus]|uniref:M23 family metallopeptidase n=1 Tax=Marinobacter caseinilyticus TaxID=2692195 RepID=UPI00140C8F23|nr:M23 family metallopeptidase [Marinobacter caseinilyticus]
MNIILMGKRHGKSRVLPINTPVTIGLVMIVSAFAGSAAWLGYSFADAKPATQQAVVSSPVVSEWQARIQDQRSELDRVNEKTLQQVDALTLRLGEIQGRLLRLDALGQRFVESGLVGSEEFNFDQPAAVGGPEGAMDSEPYSTPELSKMIEQLDTRLADREQQLRLLDSLMSRKKIEDDRFVAGRPITWGWLSSRYGYRSDPFNGRRTWHDGVDLAGKDGSDIIAVAAGVVTYASDRHGYGNLVEVDHGDGLVTRYGHCKLIKVKTGDVVEKGEVLALMGSTGRSTGPHVHFEVLRNGKSQNPEEYIQRASR